MSHTDLITAAVAASGAAGLSGREIAAQTGIIPGSCTVYIGKLRQSGVLIAAGPFRSPWSRYFVDQGHADAYGPIAQKMRDESVATKNRRKKVRELARHHADKDNINAKARAKNAEKGVTIKPRKASQAQKASGWAKDAKPTVVPQATYGTFKPAAKINMSNAKWTIAPTPPDRYSHSGPVHGGFASLRPGQYAFPPASCAARASA